MLIKSSCPPEWYNTFYNMCHQPQVVADQRFARGGIPGAHGGEGGLFLLGGKRLGKAAGFQPEGQVEQMRSSRLQKSHKIPIIRLHPCTMGMRAAGKR